jgi:transcriptional regulator with XRE-family HTH domain
MSVYQQITKYRKLRKITVKELAEMIGMSETGYHQMISKDSLKVKILFKIAEALKVHPALFFKDEEHRYENNENTVVTGVNDNTSAYQARSKILEKEIKYLKNRIKDKELIINDKENTIKDKEEIIYLLKQNRQE